MQIALSCAAVAPQLLLVRCLAVAALLGGLPRDLKAQSGRGGDDALAACLVRLTAQASRTDIPFADRIGQNNVVRRCLWDAYPTLRAEQKAAEDRAWPYGGCSGGGERRCELMFAAIKGLDSTYFWNRLPPLATVGPVERCVRLISNRRMAAPYCASPEKSQGVLYSDFARPRLCPPGGTKDCRGQAIDHVEPEEYMPIDLSTAGGPSLDAWPEAILGADGQTMIAYRFLPIEKRYANMPYSTAISTCVDDFVTFNHQRATTNVTSAMERAWRIMGQGVCRAKVPRR